MSLLQLFLIMFPDDYLEEVLIPETNKGLSVPREIQEFIKWVGCWLYGEIIPSLIQLPVPVVVSPCLGTFSGVGSLPSSIEIP